MAHIEALIAETLARDGTHHVFSLSGEQVTPPKAIETSAGDQDRKATVVA